MSVSFSCYFFIDVMWDFRREELMKLIILVSPCCRGEFRDYLSDGDFDLFSEFGLVGVDEMGVVFEEVEEVMGDDMTVDGPDVVITDKVFEQYH